MNTLNILDLIFNNRLGDFNSCWLCNCEPNGLLTFEDHHILPKHLGGTNGPLVYLCADCHTNVHKCATKLLAGKTFVPYKEAIKKIRCLSLAKVIADATQQLEKNPINKIYVYSGVFDYETHEKLVKLTKYFSTNKKISQQDIIKMALSSLYQKIF